MSETKPLRIAVLGCGFWSQFQIAAWQELPGVKIVALYNRTISKAQALGSRFGVPAVYDDAEALVRVEHPDVIDIITDVDTHPVFVELAARHRIPVICQKPMASTLAQCERMVAMCREAGVPLFIHENWRWQHTMRQLKRIIDAGQIGRIYRARVDYITGYPVFDNQPFLATIEQFILTDIGSHIFDACRFLFGEASSLYCQIGRVHRDIKGEDVATATLRMGAGAIVTCNMAYAVSAPERDRFPQTQVFIEAESGSLELELDYRIRLTTADGTLVSRYPAPRYAWVDGQYEIVHTSIVPCNQNLLEALRGQGRAETSGEDNLKTMRLVFAAYDSARADAVVKLQG